jgi:thiazole/oxazole-forming peptide maturase SagD family component
MHLLVGAGSSPLAPKTGMLLRRMLCPLSGLTPGIGFAKRAPLEPRIATAGGQLTGVHLLRGVTGPGEDSYHIGGSGTTYEEAVIRTLGETIERYGQFTAIAWGRQEVRTASLAGMRTQGCRVSVTPDLRFFSEAQLQRPGFRFSSIDAQAPLGWVPARSLIDRATRWVPAQQTIVGYVRRPDEPAFMSAVTTGTAAHTKLEDAVRNALLELSQIDAAVGHWYGASQALMIAPGARTRAVDDLVRSRVHEGGPEPTFHWLPSPDLPGLTVACVLRAPEAPRCAIGLGCDLRLSRAMYKAFLEAAGVAQLAKVLLVRRAAEAAAPNGMGIHQDAMYDLDANVVHYALRPGAVIDERFGAGTVTRPSDLPPDVHMSRAGELRLLVDAFARTNKDLVFLDLTSRDIKELGFCVVRLWSPDLLGLPLPSAPPLLHPRFEAYGGATNEAPHPYP